VNDAPRFLAELNERRHVLRGEPIEYRRHTDVYPRCICEQFPGPSGKCFTCDRVFGYTEDLDDIGLAPAEEE
jgi:hypothetical protein